ncbi:hypothetical protein [Brevundimonas balnearis]|uniref:Uncharacterized protein n=1 Tax=Brevundimonas balnearis TaxID=1572858 RepID=A0ABV6R3Y1_9CAUL
MANLLTDKDDHWRDRPNAATPVADPGLAPLGVDEEAGGASSPSRADPGEGRRPLPTQPDSGGIGVRLTPAVWYGVGAVLLVVVLVAIGASL